MAERTYAEMKTLVGQKLGVLAAGESLSYEDAKTIGDALLNVEAQLDRLNIASFDVQNGIDYAYADAFADMACALLVEVFQVPEPRASQLKTQGMLNLPGQSSAERRMRRLADGITSKLSTTVELYD